MKLLTEKVYSHSEIAQDPYAVDKIKDYLIEEMAKKVANKITFAQRYIDRTQSGIVATVNVMNDAELKAAKAIFDAVIAAYPETEDSIKRALEIIDPLGNF